MIFRKFFSSIFFCLKSIFFFQHVPFLFILSFATSITKDLNIFVINRIALHIVLQVFSLREEKSNYQRFLRLTWYCSRFIGLDITIRPFIIACRAWKVNKGSKTTEISFIFHQILNKSMNEEVCIHHRIKV